MKVEIGPDPELETALLCRPTGRLEASEVGAFWEAVTAQLAPGRPSVLLDMGGVQSVSSSGLGVIVRLLGRVRELNGSLAIFGCAPRVCAILHVVRLGPVLNLSQTPAEAREKLTAAGIA